MNRCEREIDAIRLKLYEETKNLTRKEQMKRTRDNAQKLAAEYGFTLFRQLIIVKRKIYIRLYYALRNNRNIRERKFKRAVFIQHAARQDLAAAFDKTLHIKVLRVYGKQKNLKGFYQKFHEKQ